MGDAGYKGYVLCVADYEEDFLFLLGDQGVRKSLRGISDFIEEAGGQAIRSALPHAFKYEDDPDPEINDDNFWKGIRDEYRESTGRKNLPVMRVKVTVEVETLTDEEAGRVWEDHVRVQRRHNDPNPGTSG